jgi:hypothetical protein
MMPDASLHGNGDDCPACALRRDELRAARAMDQSVPCNFCGGEGRVGRAVAAIIREACAWAIEHYWPAKEAEWRAQNEGGIDGRD